MAIDLGVRKCMNNENGYVLIGKGQSDILPILELNLRAGPVTVAPSRY